MSSPLLPTDLCRNPNSLAKEAGVVSLCAGLLEFMPLPTLRLRCSCSALRMRPAPSRSLKTHSLLAGKPFSVFTLNISLTLSTYLYSYLLGKIACGYVPLASLLHDLHCTLCIRAVTTLSCHYLFTCWPLTWS